MNSKTGIIEQLNPAYFWDVDVNRLQDESASRLVVERIFNLGNLHEIKLIVEFYGRDTVVDILSNLTYIEPKTFNFITKLFQVPETKFRCHTQRQLKTQHWRS